MPKNIHATIDSHIHLMILQINEHIILETSYFQHKENKSLYV